MTEPASTTSTTTATRSDGSVEMRGISKSFFGTKALKSVDFSCKAGEVHALVGLNGAGKSTLMKVLGGVYDKDDGEILIDGKLVEINKPSDASAAGIAMIHQEYSLIGELSVARNIFLGREIASSRTRFLDKKAMNDRVNELLERFGLEIDPRRQIRTLNSGQKQVAEILRALLSDSWLIVMDEPTSALSEEDKLKLFEFIERMKQENIGMIYISHHMPEIFSIADRVTVMRDGDVVLSGSTSEVTEAEVIHAMTGEELESFVKPEKQAGDTKVLEVSGLSRGETFNDVSFSVAEGEIVAMNGLRGCGGPEIAKAIFGLDKDYEGSISYLGKPLKKGTGPRLAVQSGMGFVSENRDTNGILPPRSVSDNIALPFLYKRSHLGLIDERSVAQVVDRAVRQTGTKLESSGQEIRFLSGGNKQKVCFSRWLDDDIKLLILLEPTRGIDVHAKADIYRIIEDLAERGVGILVMSYEVDEVLLLADRLLTLYQGDVVGDYSRTTMDKGRILADIAGADKVG